MSHETPQLLEAEHKAGKDLVRLQPPDSLGPAPKEPRNWIRRFVEGSDKAEIPRERLFTVAYLP